MAWVDSFNLCLGIYIVGHVRANKSTTTTIGGEQFQHLTKPRIIDPYMLVTTKKSCDDSSSVKKRHRMNQFTWRTYGYGYKCSYDPSYSFAVPWSVGVGITPDCGDERVVRFGQTQKRGTTRTYRFELETDGVAFGWDQKDTAHHATGGVAKLCSSISAYLIMVDNTPPTVKTVHKKVSFPDFCVRW